MRCSLQLPLCGHGWFTGTFTHVLPASPSDGLDIGSKSLFSKPKTFFDRSARKVAGVAHSPK
jgi:hypothetical protein